MLSHEYDKEADAIYIKLSESEYAYGKDLDDGRRIDYSKNGQPIGVELLCASKGVNLTGIPDEVQIAQVLTKYKIPTYTISSLTSNISGNSIFNPKIRLMPVLSGSNVFEISFAPIKKGKTDNQPEIKFIGEEVTV